MRKNVLKYINQLEGFKTTIKSLHWTAKSMNEHKLMDDVADAVSDIQDMVAEIEQGMHGRIGKRELRPIKCGVTSSKGLLQKILTATNDFLATIKGKEYVGMKSEVETFQGKVNQFFYLLDLSLKEDVERRLKSSLNEVRMHGIIKESINRILHEAVNEKLIGQIQNLVQDANNAYNNNCNSFDDEYCLLSPDGDYYGLEDDIKLVNGVLRIPYMSEDDDMGGNTEEIKVYGNGGMFQGGGDSSYIGHQVERENDWKTAVRVLGDIIKDAERYRSENL